MGVGLNKMCSSSSDCDPLQYCNLGRCVAIKILGSVCYHRNECGREATCFFTDPNSIAGTCQEYFKIDNGSPLNVSMRIDSYSVINDDSHLMCRSQYANSSGICAPGIRSLNKGKVCKNQTMCRSVEDPNVFAKCTCGWNGNKTRYCDLLPGDDEWINVR